VVYFVGAGSGAVDLITVRGARLLAQADLVVYAGSLVNPELLGYAKAGAELRDSAGMTLGEVMEALLAADAAGKLVVRLHTGDPSLYGAIREQMDCLDAAGVAYEVVPGVSALGGAAAAFHPVAQYSATSRMTAR
jgi:precorrin-4/cobalt-precorrin-4 C11-methyltransferase